MNDINELAASIVRDLYSVSFRIDEYLAKNVKTHPNIKIMLQKASTEVAHTRASIRTLLTPTKESDPS